MGRRIRLRLASRNARHFPDIALGRELLLLHDIAVRIEFAVLALRRDRRGQRYADVRAAVKDGVGDDLRRRGRQGKDRLLVVDGTLVILVVAALIIVHINTRDIVLRSIAFTFDRGAFRWLSPPGT